MDPNLGRVIEETIGVVSDVENRLQALKVGISQAIPQLAPTLLWREQALASLAQRHMGSPLGLGVNAFASPFGIVGAPVLPFASIPNVPALSPTLAGLTSPISPLAFGGSPIAGVTNPFGIASPFRLY